MNLYASIILFCIIQDFTSTLTFFPNGRVIAVDDFLDTSFAENIRREGRLLGPKFYTYVGKFLNLQSNDLCVISIFMKCTTKFLSATDRMI